MFHDEPLRILEAAAKLLMWKTPPPRISHAEDSHKKVEWPIVVGSHSVVSYHLAKRDQTCMSGSRNRNPSASELASNDSPMNFDSEVSSFKNNPRVKVCGCVVVQYEYSACLVQLHLLLVRT